MSSKMLHTCLRVENLEKSIADVEDFNKIHEKGVKITSQMVPNDTAEDFMKLLK